MEKVWKFIGQIILVMTEYYQGHCLSLFIYLYLLFSLYLYKIRALCTLAVHMISVLIGLRRDCKVRDPP